MSKDTEPSVAESYRIRRTLPEDRKARPSIAEEPLGTRGITLGDLKRFRVDQAGRLSWDGKLVQVQRRVTFTVWQGLAVGIVTLAAASMGLLAGLVFGCRLGWLVTGCFP